MREIFYRHSIKILYFCTNTISPGPRYAERQRTERPGEDEQLTRSYGHREMAWPCDEIENFAELD